MDGSGTLTALTHGDAGEVPALRRAACVAGASAHRDLHILALTQTLADLHAPA